ncbi:unnamed protein product, partial [Medioppia subpectinata]
IESNYIHKRPETIVWSPPSAQCLSDWPSLGLTIGSSVELCVQPFGQYICGRKRRPIGAYECVDHMAGVALREQLKQLFDRQFAHLLESHAIQLVGHFFVNAAAAPHWLIHGFPLHHTVHAVDSGRHGGHGCGRRGGGRGLCLNDGHRLCGQTVVTIVTIVALAVAVPVMSSCNEMNGELDYRRDSFGDRICDDLCEEVLKWLPLEDKFGLESVCKQFQRCVYRRVDTLVVSLIRLTNEDKFECLLRKCHNIGYIHISLESLCRWHPLTAEDINQVFFNRLIELIIKYCNHLTSFTLDLNRMTDETYRRFCDKFAKSVTSIDLTNDYENIDKHLKVFANIKTFNSPVNLMSLLDENHCLVNNMTKCVMNLDAVYKLSIFVDHNHRLRVLHINTHGIADKDITYIYRQICGLKHLEVLKHKEFTTVEMGYRSAKEALIEVANNCLKLRQLSIDWQINIDKHLLFDAFKHFKRLQRLNVSLELSYDLCSNITSKTFSQCKQLKHLSLDILFRDFDFSDEFFADIDIHLPQIQSLSLHVKNLAIDGINSIAKLKKLENLILESMDVLSDEHFYTIQDNCPKIKCIWFIAEPGLSEIVSWIIKSNDPQLMDKPEMDEYKYNCKYTHYYLNNGRITVVLSRVPITMSSCNEMNGELDYRRDSFGDRICDDLCEEVLKWLPIKDKIRLESVCKQFQRCVYKKEYFLDTDSLFKRKKDVVSYKTTKQLNAKNFECLLKKFPNITNIEMTYATLIDAKLYNRLIELIIEYCNRLTSFTLDLNRMTDETYRRFCDKFAKSVTSIHFPDGHDIEKDLKVFADITEVDVSQASNSPIRLNDQLKTLLDNNHTLREFYIETNYVNTDNWIYIYQQISNLKHLEVFGHSDAALDNINTKIVRQSLTQLANNCSKLKRLSLDIPLDSSHQWLLFDAIKHFKRLQHLYISLHMSDDSLDLLTFRSNITSKTFSQCKQLKHLSLMLFHREFDFSDEFFADIDIHLPRLQSMNLRVEDITVDVAINSVAKLKKLQDMTFYTSDVLSDEHFYGIQDNCLKLKTIEFMIENESTNTWIIKSNNPQLLDKEYLDFYKYDNHVIHYYLNNGTSVQTGLYNNPYI